jgi:O-antigen/teichoic acid export membrane protein
MAATNQELSTADSLSVPERKARPRNQFILNTATILGAQVGRSVSSLLLEVVYARFLGPAGRGQLSLCMMVLGFGVLLGGLGGEIPIMLWSADEKRRTSDWLPAIVLCGLLGSMLACGSWVLLFWWWHPVFLRGINPSLALLVATAIPLSIFGTYALSLLIGLNRVRERSVVVVLNQFVTLAAAVAFLYLFRSAAELGMVAVLVGLIAALLVIWRVLKDQLDLAGGIRAAYSKLGAALSLGLRGQLGNVATYFNYRLDVFVVNYYLNTAAVGLYAVGVMVSEAIWQLPNAAAMALVPRTARQLDKDATEFTCLVCRQVFFLALVAAILVAALCAWVIPLIFGESFRASVPVIWWILPGTVALAVSKVMCADLLARGMPEYSSIFAFMTLIVTVVLDFALIPRMGIQGAALASSVAYFINSAMVAMVLKRKLGVTWKVLFVPLAGDLVPYRQIWDRLVGRLRPTPAL